MALLFGHVSFLPQGEARACSSAHLFVADRVRGRDRPLRLRRRAEFQFYDHRGEPGSPRVLFHPCFSNGRISNGYTNAFSYRPVGPAFMVRIPNASTYSKPHSSPAAERRHRRDEARRLGTRLLLCGPSLHGPRYRAWRSLRLAPDCKSMAIPHLTTRMNRASPSGSESEGRSPEDLASLKALSQLGLASSSPLCQFAPYFRPSHYVGHSGCEPPRTTHRYTGRRGFQTR